MALNLSGTSGIVGAGIGTIDASGANVTGVGTFTSVSVSGGVDASSSTVTANQLTLSTDIVHSGDTDTKIRFPAADTISFETGGSEKARIDSSGRLQVGVSTGPGDSKLLLAGPDSTNYITFKNTTASDSSGARVSKIIFQGTQSGSEVSDLVHIAAMHDGGGDDQQGAFRVYVNDGNDGSSPTERFGIGQGGEYRVNQSIGSAGQVIKSAGSLNPVSWGYLVQGDLFRMNTGFTSADTDPVVNWSRQADDMFSGVPWTGMSESSGVFTFPETGIWLVTFHRESYLNGDDREVRVFIRSTTDGFSSDVENIAEAATHCKGVNSQNTHTSVETSALVDVTNTSNVKVRFRITSDNASQSTIGSSTSNRTYAQFIRLGDT
tara:strand:- start:386 stop:1519 length:1134 start_codon:yes stop_codon:yes gene_type:complete